MNTTALFIDGPNVYASSKALGFDIDYKRLLDHFQGSLIRAYYYTAVIEDAEYVSIVPLIDWLSYNGYSLVSKPAKQFTDANGRTKTKGNMDCEIAVDALELAYNGGMTEAIFFTGDGDFKALVLALQRRGVRCTVISTIVTKPPMCADELRRVADTFIELSDMSGLFGRSTVSAVPHRSRYGAERG